MNWLARALIGPSLWAVAFAAIYALHGWGCAQGWPMVETPVGSLHRVVLVVSFALSLVVTAWVLHAVPRGSGVQAQVVAAGGWIGFGGCLLTLFPVLGVSSCGW